MAGPGIRYHHMATVLAKKFDVTVGFFDPSYVPQQSFAKDYQAISIHHEKFEESFANFDSIIALWLSEPMVNFCNSNNIFLVFDVYAPVPVENLSLLLFGNNPIENQTDYTFEQSIRDYTSFFQSGDLFLFSNPRQRDYWIGYAFGSDIIRPSTYQKRPLFDRFIYAPMGIDKKDIAAKSQCLLRKKSGIQKDDKLLLWTGGIWNWFDGKVLIEAMRKLQKDRPDIKLVFLGTQHPNPDVPAMKEAADTIALAKKYGLYDKTVLIHDGWVPYNERLSYLLDADAAVNTTKPGIETIFSHRTRVLDHILAKLPTISTQGDYLSDEVVKNTIGITIPDSDVDALVSAITTILSPKENSRIRKQIAEVQQKFYWDATLNELSRALAEDMPKLNRVVVPSTRRLRKNTRLYRIGKRILPTSAKKAVIKVLRHGK